MVVYRNSARDIVERLILLRDYIHTNASPTHAVKAKDMLEYLKSKGCGRKDRGIEIKTLYADLDMLGSCFRDVKIHYDGRQKGYVLDEPPLSSYDLRLIVNSIQAAQFITQEEANRLTDKLTGLADEYTSKLLGHRRLTVNRVRTMNDSLMKNLDTIYEAIAQNKKIRYKYFKYILTNHNIGKDYQIVNNSKIILASPYSVVWKDEKFWVSAIVKLPKDIWYDKYFGCEDESEKDENFECEDMDDTKTYVFDFELLDLGRMKEIEVYSEEREGENTFLRYSGISNENKTVFCPKVKLRVNNMYIPDIIDKFGNEVSILSAGHTYFIATINEELTPELYIWTRGFSPPIEIISPENAGEELKKYLLTLINDDEPNVKLMKEVFESMEEFESS